MAVSPPGANMMMRGQKIAGSAESNGVAVSGFYVPNGQVHDHLRDCDTNHGPFSEIALHESEGWTTFLGVHQPLPQTPKAGWKVAFYRRESHKFFEDFGAWFFRTGSTSVHRLSISQSSGFLSLTLLYSDESRV